MKNTAESKSLTSLIENVVQDTLEETFVTEGLKPKVNVTINGKQVNFGSRAHIMDLKRVLMGLERLKDCYAKGTANRHVYANSCTKLRRLIKKLILDLRKNAPSRALAQLPATTTPPPSPSTPTT